MIEGRTSIPASGPGLRVRVFLVWTLLCSAAWAQEPAAPPRRQPDLSTTVQKTLEYRIEEARRHLSDGQLQKAEAAYDELLRLYDTEEPLVIRAWLESAMLKGTLKKPEQSLQLLQEALTRFGHIPWAAQRAQEQLSQLTEANPDLLAGNPAASQYRKKKDGFQIVQPPSQVGMLRVDMERPQVIGQLSHDLVRRVIHARLDKVRLCYAAAIAEKPNLAGKIVVTFTIQESGAVTNARVSSSTASHPALERCLVQQVQAVRFPSPKGDKNVEVSYPFAFSSAGYSEPSPAPSARDTSLCSISGKVLSAEEGKPVTHAKIHLLHEPTSRSSLGNVAGDGSFEFRNIPCGNYLLRTMRTAGFRDTGYNPESKSGSYPGFILGPGERRSGVVLRLKPSFSISGKLVEKSGMPLKNSAYTTVLAWPVREDLRALSDPPSPLQAKINPEDGSFFLDSLDGKPVWMMAVGNPSPDSQVPRIFYPGTFVRSEASKIAFGADRFVENLDLRLPKDRGNTLEGVVTAADTGKPIPNALIIAHALDTGFDLVSDYTDAQGRYQIEALSDGPLLCHVDAAQEGFVPYRAGCEIRPGTRKTQLHFSLHRGATLRGTLLDEKGAEWKIQPNASCGTASASGARTQAITLPGLVNKFRPRNLQDSMPVTLPLGQGDYPTAVMLFPTRSSFVIPGAAPGKLKIQFKPQIKSKEVRRILYQGQDILKTGIRVEAGQQLEGLKIVVGG